MDHMPWVARYDQSAAEIRERLHSAFPGEMPDVVSTSPLGRSEITTRRLRGTAHVVLAVVAALGAAISYTSLQQAAAKWFPGSSLSYGFPLLVDALVLGASLQYVAGSRARAAGRNGWRLTAHTGIAGTILLNALAVLPDTAAVPWHVTAPAVWGVLVELYARTAAGQWRAEHDTSSSIPARLWFTAPVESARTWLRQARLSAAVNARVDVGRHAAALEALRWTIPGRGGRRSRAVIRRQLRAGSVTPDAVLAACGWTVDGAAAPDPLTVLRATLCPLPKGRTRAVALPSAPTVAPGPAPRPDPQGAGQAEGNARGSALWGQWVNAQVRAGLTPTQIRRQAEDKYGVNAPSLTSIKNYRRDHGGAT